MASQRPRSNVLARRIILDADLHSVGDVFHENTKFHHLSENLIYQGGRTSPISSLGTIVRDAPSPALPATATPRDAEGIDWKEYDRYPQHPLPTHLPADASFADVLLRRRSRREFDGRALSKGELGSLLMAACGVTSPKGFRTAPSGGGLYPIEAYVLRLIGDRDLPSGIYHYNIRKHLLEAIPSKDSADAPRVSRILLRDALIERAAAVIVLTGVFDRTRIKYGERGYRYILFEAGHIMQNLLLATRVLGLGGYPVGGFIDEEMDRLLGLDGKEERALYCGVIGRLETQPRMDSTD